MTAGASARDVGLRLLKEGSVRDSVDFLLQAIVEEPSDVDLHLFLALAYAKQEQIDKAVEILEQAVDLAPTSPKVHFNLGIAYQRSHNITQAKDEFLRALGLDPNYAVAKQALDAITEVHNDGMLNNDS